MIIRLHQHPFAAEPPQVFQTDSLATWLLDRYGDTPKVGVQVFAGEPSVETDVTGDTAAILRGDAPIYVVLESPGAPLVPILINIAISIALNVVMTLLFGKKEPLANRTQESANNQLSNRENGVRLLERVEDIYGTVRAIPSLMMPPYTKYVDHRRVEYGYYCVGRGYHDIADVRDGDTLLADITGSSAAVYAPFTSPNSGAAQLQIGDAIIDNVVTVSRANEVDGITLKAPNEVQLPNDSISQYQYEPGGLITQAEKRPNFNAVCVVGEQLAISMPDYTVELSPAVPPDEFGNGGQAAITGTYNYSGTYTITAVGDGTVTVGGTAWPVVIPFMATSGTPDDPGGGGDPE